MTLRNRLNHIEQRTVRIRRRVEREEDIANREQEIDTIHAESFERYPDAHKALTIMIEKGPPIEATTLEARLRFVAGNPGDGNVIRNCLWVATDFQDETGDRAPIWPDRSRRTG